MLTSSGQETDIDDAYRLGANGFLTKPGNPADLLAMMKAIKDFWLRLNRLAPNPAGIGGRKPGEQVSGVPE